MLSGGGAKGAYAFGCLKAFKERDIKFDAVSGTSVGGLNAMLWSTKSMDEGQKLWDGLSYSTVYPVQLLSPKYFPRFVIQTLAVIFVFLNFIACTIRGIKHPATSYTALILTVVASFPYLVSSMVFVVVAAVSLPVLVPAIDAKIMDAVAGAAMLGLFPLLFVGLIYISYRDHNFRTAMFASWLCSLSSLIISFLTLAILGAIFESEKFVLNGTFFLLGVGIFFFILAVIPNSQLYVGLIVDNILGSFGTVLDSTPLYKTASDILSSKPLTIPTFVTTGSNQDVYDPDNNSWTPIHEKFPKAFLNPGELSIVDPVEKWAPDHPFIPPEAFDLYEEYSILDPEKTWVPHYVDLQSCSIEEAVFRCVATAALPFGIVPSVKIQDKDYVDGGVIDNTPFYPFMDDLPAEEIYIVLLDHVESDEEAQRKSKIDSEHWSEMERLQRVAELPQQVRRENGPKKPIPYKTQEHFPKLRFFYPKTESLGGPLTGTLNFNGDYARKIMERGYVETLKNLSEKHGTINTQ